MPRIVLRNVWCPWVIYRRLKWLLGACGLPLTLVASDKESGWDGNRLFPGDQGGKSPTKTTQTMRSSGQIDRTRCSSTRPMRQSEQEGTSRKTRFTSVSSEPTSTVFSVNDSDLSVQDFFYSFLFYQSNTSSRVMTVAVDIWNGSVFLPWCREVETLHWTWSVTSGSDGVFNRGRRVRVKFFNHVYSKIFKRGT